MMSKAYWAGWDYGSVKHAWKSHPLNPDYRNSACGYLAHWERLLTSDARECKNCQRVIKRAVDNETKQP